MAEYMVSIEHSDNQYLLGVRGLPDTETTPEGFDDNMNNMICHYQQISNANIALQMYARVTNVLMDILTDIWMYKHTNRYTHIPTDVPSDMLTDLGRHEHTGGCTDWCTNIPMDIGYRDILIDIWKC